MGVIDVSPAIELFVSKVKAMIPSCEDPEKEIRQSVRLSVKKNSYKKSQIV